MCCVCVPLAMVFGTKKTIELRRACASGSGTAARTPRSYFYSGPCVWIGDPGHPACAQGGPDIEDWFLQVRLITVIRPGWWTRDFRRLAATDTSVVMIRPQAAMRNLHFIG